MNYTIEIPDDVHRAISERAAAEDKSIRTVMLEAIARGLGIEFKPEWVDDLGTKRRGP